MMRRKFVQIRECVLIFVSEGRTEDGISFKLLENMHNFYFFKKFLQEISFVF